MRLYLIDLGHCDADKGMVLTPGSDVGKRVIIPIVGYLIQTDDGQNILVDSGMHRKHIEDPEATFGGTEFGNYLSVLMNPEDDIANRLAELGLKPEDIDILVSTHFHFDHAGNHADFYRSRIVSQREHYEYAKANPAPFPRDIWDLPQLEYELIDGDMELAPGVQLIKTNGHAPGHMSVDSGPEKHGQGDPGDRRHLYIRKSRAKQLERLSGSRRRHWRAQPGWRRWRSGRTRC